MRRSLCSICTMLLLSPLAWAEVKITEWQVPWENSRPRDPYVADEAAHRVWFVGQRSHYLAYLDPRSGEFTRIPLADGAGPHNVIVAEDGTAWYAGNRQAHIGRYRVGDEGVHTIPMPGGHPRDPHTLIFDPSGRYIWFTAQGANVVGRLDIADETVQIIEVPTPRARPYGIVVDGQGQPWVVLFGTHKLARIDPDSMQLEEIELTRTDARPRRLAVADDGAVWYVDYAKGYLGRYDPASGDIREWASPSGEQSRPYAMAIDDKDRIWYFESGPNPNRLIGFDIARERFLAPTEIPSGGGTVRHAVFHAATNSIWFGTDTNTIGKAALQ